MKKLIVISFCLIISTILTGCAREMISRSIATIDVTQGWKVQENCGFEGCYPLVDYLKGEYLSIRFDLFNTIYDAKNEHFSIRLSFETPTDKICTYNPTNTTLNYKGTTYTPYRFITFGETKIDSNEKRVIPFELNSKRMPRYEMNSLFILLFFPVENIPTNESFSLKIHDLLCNGREIISPTVNFREGLRK